MHVDHSGFGEGTKTDTDVNQEQLDREESLRKLKAKLDAELNEAMLKILVDVRAELDSGTLHGLVIVRVNQEHQLAKSVAICNSSAEQMGSKLQEMSMELSLPPAALREIRQLMRMLRGKLDS